MGMPVITASSITREQAITDLIQSVALEEAALSHIHNAEGEKIQKVVALPDVTPDLILKISIIQLKSKQDLKKCQNLESFMQRKF